MGLFGSKYTTEEKEILDFYTQLSVTMGVPASDARKMTEETLDELIDASKKRGTYNLPRNFGDVILGIATSNDPAIMKLADGVREHSPQKREEGVKDEDIQWWWNMSDVGRRMMLKQDEMARTNLFIGELKNNTLPSKEEAGKKAATAVRKFHPLYGYPQDTREASGEDRPLPHELKDRINIYVGKRAETDPATLKKDMEDASSFNALVRRDIREGRI